LESDAVARARPLIASKLRPPVPITGQRERPRISACLAGALGDDVRLTLVSAPPGYGKTVAVASWLESASVPRAWLALDPADNDPVRFLRYLVAALEPVRPGIADAVGDPALLGAEAGERLIAALAQSDDPVAVVLDDYHEITAEPVHAIVRRLVVQGPPFVHLVIATREDPPLPVARLRANRTLVELRAADLRLSLDEADEYLRASPGLQLDAPHVAQLVDRTEGWFAGLQLAALSLRDRSDATELVESLAGSQRFVLDYLAAETLDRLEPDLRLFLIRTSVAGRFSAELCDELTGRGDAGSMLALAERMNLFIVPLDLERRWYRFHHLFADYLRLQLGDRERRDLHARAAGWFERAGLPSEAVEQAVLAQDAGLAVQLVEAATRETYRLGEFTTLLGWVDALPQDRFLASPELVARAAAALLLVGRYGEAERLCAGREATLTRQGSPWDGLAAVRALLAARLGRPRARELARAALESLREDDEFRPLALDALGTVQLADGELSAAASSLEAALEASLAREQPSVAVLAVARLAAALNLTGRRGEAEAWCRRVLAELGLADGPIRGGPAYVAWRLGIFRYEANDLPGATRELERAWSGLAATPSMRSLIGFAVADLARLRLASGDANAAIQAIEAVRRDGDTTWRASIENRLAEIEARVRLWAGELGAAAAWADHVEPPVDSGWPALPFTMDLARVRLAQHRSAEAHHLLQEARATARRVHDVPDLITIDVLEATRADQVGAQAAARDAIEEAVGLAAPERYLRRLIDDGQGVAHLLPAARRLAPAFVDAVLEAMGGGSGMPSSVRPGRGRLWLDEHGDVVEALTARELEVLRLMASGLSDAAIAEALVVSPATAKWHAAHVRAKLRARTRSGALARARELGILA
jgi:ATP/maltotriose-dependent transcriptional regulator MalT